MEGHRLWGVVDFKGTVYGMKGHRLWGEVTVYGMKRVFPDYTKHNSALKN